MGEPTCRGREDDVRALTELLDGVRHAGSALVLLGDPGVGTSFLLELAVQQARDAGFCVVETVGVEAESGIPYAGLHQLLSSLLHLTPSLPAVQAAALRTALGQQGGVPPELFLVALATLNLLGEAAAARPVLVAADDVHWLDRSTHEVLAFVARRLAADPVCLVATVRTGHPGPLTSAGLPARVLREVGEQAARQILHDHDPDLDAHVTERILQTAAGNPLALVELPVAWRAAGAVADETTPAEQPMTARLERAFAGRSDRLPPPSRTALLVAALSSSNDVAATLAAASAVEGRPVPLQALDRAAEAGLLRHDGSTLAFRHPMVRSGLVGAEPVARRQAAHAALAVAFRGEPYRSVWHRAQAIVGPDDDVADELERSSVQSLRRGAVVPAIQALERAAQLTAGSSARGRRLLMAAEHAFGLGRTDLVQQLLAAAAQQSLDRRETTRLQWLREISRDGVPGDAAHVAELCAAAEDAAAAGDTGLALDLLVAASLRCWWADTGPAARARVVEAVEGLIGVEDDPRSVAAIAIAEPVRCAQRVVAALDRVRIEAVDDADALRLLGFAAHAAGDDERTADLLDRAELKLRAEGRLGLLTQVFAVQMSTLTDLGDWHRLAAAAEEGRRLAQDTGQPIWTAGTLVGDARAAALAGRASEAFALASKAEVLVSRQRLNCLLSSVEHARGIAWITLGRHAEAFSVLRRLVDPDDPCFHHKEGVHGVMFLAEAAWHAGLVEEGRALLAGLEEVQRATPTRRMHKHLLYARAVLADDDHAEELFRAALAEDLVRWPWLRARLELAHGSWLRRRRRAADARGPLRSALATLESIGARTWAEQARSELRASGEKAVGTVPVPQQRLSAQELQIARLAAEGLSNKEIGQRLFLSPRTVGSHLYRVFPKLDVTSRGQLASRLSPS